MLMRKGFIGPIGDDLPSIIAIMLALGLFFSAVIYTMNIYNQKISDMETLKGSIELARVVLDKGILTEINPPAAAYVAQSYALNYNTSLDDGPSKCADNSYKFSYLVASSLGGDIRLQKLTICTWKRNI